MTAQSLNIVVEGQTDVDILKAILGDVLPARTRFYAADGKMSLVTLARNLLVHEGDPVVVVMDADTLNAKVSAEQQAMARLAMRNVAPGGQFEVFAFVPELEAVLFENPDVLEQLLGTPIPAEAKREGLLVPKQVLTALIDKTGASKDYRSLIRSIDSITGEKLRSGKQAAALKATIQHMLEHAA